MSSKIVFCGGSITKGDGWNLQNEEDRSKVDDLRGSPLSVGTLEELIDEKYVFFYRSVLNHF